MRFEAEPHRDRVAHECEFDSLAGQDLGLAGEQQPGPAPPCYPCFIWSRSGIDNSLNDNSYPLTGADVRESVV